MYHDGQAPYGIWPVRAAYASREWLDDQAPQADYAFLTVGSQVIDGRVRTLQSVVGGDILVTERPPPEWTVVVGYPAQKGGGAIICLNRTFARRGYPAFRCGGFVNGTSGGPWLSDYSAGTGRGALYGVTGGRYQGGCVSFVSYTSGFDVGALGVFAQASAGAAPDELPDPRSSPC